MLGSKSKYRHQFHQLGHDFKSELEGVAEKSLLKNFLLYIAILILALVIFWYAPTL